MLCCLRCCAISGVCVVLCCLILCCCILCLLLCYLVLLYLVSSYHLSILCGCGCGCSFLCWRCPVKITIPKYPNSDNINLIFHVTSGSVRPGVYRMFCSLVLLRISYLLVSRTSLSSVLLRYLVVLADNPCRWTLCGNMQGMRNG